MKHRHLVHQHINFKDFVLFVLDSLIHSVKETLAAGILMAQQEIKILKNLMVSHKKSVNTDVFYKVLPGG